MGFDLDGPLLYNPPDGICPMIVPDRLRRGQGMMPASVRSAFALFGLCLGLLCLGADAASAYAVAYPGKAPGKASAQRTDDRIVLRNEVLRVAWRIEEGRLWLDEAADLANDDGCRARGGELFVLTLSDGQRLRGSLFRLEAAPGLVEIAPNPTARRLAERSGGWRAAARLVSEDGRVQVQWEATLRDESNYVIQRLSLLPVEKALPIDAICLIDVNVPNAVANATVMGATQGAPVVAGAMFFAYEHPMSVSHVEGARITCALKRGQSLGAGQPLTQSAVIGTTPAGQLRRGFLYYVERERAHPYRPFLHYNSWYDIAWADRKFDERQSIAAIEKFGEELITKRGVVMDSFVFDDGWDDNTTLWQFHDGFPNGFRPLREAAAKYGAAVGAWLSPFGGYGKAREQRLAYGKRQEFETNRAGFSLSGERYYARFLAICQEMIQEYGVNFFKFDGMGTGGQATAAGGAEFLDDIEALMRLVAELREVMPDLYVSATTGTWCSPYFLWHADSTWRGAGDMGFFGKGSKRQQWITYRDLHTFRNVVQRGPLYPLNSLMTQGIAHARHGSAGQLGDDLKEMADEIRSFFGSGTGLQELYVAPGLLSAAQWDLLAEGARWARANADVLIDTHWVGGNPGEGEVYGWASWSPRKGILVLRNPTDSPATITIDIGQAFELPDGAAGRYRLSEPWRKEEGAPPALDLLRGAPHGFELDGFQVLVFDAMPSA